MPNIKRGSRIVVLVIAAALGWTVVAAEPAFARHNRARPFSIASNEVFSPENVPPKIFTCRWINYESGKLVHDYGCGRGNFSRLLEGTTSGSGDGLLSQGDTADKKTPVMSPTTFTCKLRGDVPRAQRRPSDYSCTTTGGTKFRLSGVAFVWDVKNRSLEYALPCAKRNCAVT
jgi:hypothetical protein